MPPRRLPILSLSVGGGEENKDKEEYLLGAGTLDLQLTGGGALDLQLTGRGSVPWICSGRGCDEERKNIDDEEQGVYAALQGKEENTSFIFFFISFDD